MLATAIGYSNDTRVLIFTFAQAMDVGVVPAGSDFAGEISDGTGTQFFVGVSAVWADAEHLHLTLDPEAGGVVSGEVTYSVSDPNTWQTVEGVPVCAFGPTAFVAIN